MTVLQVPRLQVSISTAAPCCAGHQPGLHTSQANMLPTELLSQTQPLCCRDSQRLPRTGLQFGLFLEASSEGKASVLFFQRPTEALKLPEMGPSLSSGARRQLLSKTREATYFIDFRGRIKLCCLRDVGLVFQRRQELQKGKQSLQIPRAGTSPVRGTTIAGVVPQGLNSRVPTWIPWTTDMPDLGSPSMVLLSSQMKGCMAAEFPAAPGGRVQLHYSPS